MTRLAVPLLAIGLAAPSVSQEHPLRAVNIEFGIKDFEPTQWDGSLSLDKGQIIDLRGHRFKEGESIGPDHSWVARTDPWVRPTGGMHPHELPFPRVTIVQTVGVTLYYRAPDDVPQLAARVQEYADAGCLVTLDRLVDGLQGGTGQRFDLDVAASMAHRGGSFILAGGLTPANVGRVISVVRPWGVDVSTGVETIGKKDRGKIRRFIGNARDADAALTGLI